MKATLDLTSGFAPKPYQSVVFNGFVAAFFLVFGLLFATPVGAQSYAQINQCNQKMYVHQGIVILGFPCPLTSTVSVLPTQQGVDKIIQAVDLISKKSPRSFAVIETLKKSGPVIIIYDPNYPPPGTNISSSQIAMFLPTFIEQFDQTATGKQFTVIVGRDGIKWPLVELSAVLVHELMGHGKQHLEDRLDTMRSLDMECEAWLREEMAYQDLGLDKMSQGMVDFRSQLENLHCSDFIAYMRKRVPDQVGLWDVKNPDVPKLLRLFDGYIQAQRDRGMIRTAKAAMARQLDEAISKAERQGNPDDLYAIGAMYMSSVGVPKNATKAATWYRKAAQKGHAMAQFSLGQFYEQGQGVEQNLGLAARLYVSAAKQGMSQAFYALGVMYETGNGVKQDDQKAKNLYLRARQGIDPRPLVIFGIMHNDGTGFRQNHAKAYDLFLKAARLGDRAAQFELGLLFEQGAGVPKDINVALSWIRKSARQGFPLAKQKLVKR